MIQSITKNSSSSQQSIDGGRNVYGSNAPESTINGLLRGTKKWRQNPKNRAKEVLWNKMWRKKNWEKFSLTESRGRILRRYGLTLEDFNNLFLKQDKKCAICKKELPDGFSIKKHIDHCHKTNRIRGILCNKCNSLIGMAEENETILLSAINYIKQFCL